MIYKISIGNQIIDQVFTDFESAQQEAFELSSRDQLEPQIIEVKGKVILQPIFVAVESEAQKILDNFPPAPPEPKVPAKKKAVKKDPVSLQNVSETVEPKQAPVQTLEPKPILENVEVIDIGSEEVDDAIEVFLQDQKFNEDKVEELTPLEQLTEEVEKPKMYKCSLGIPMKEEAVKESCATKIKETMEQGKTAENLKAVIRSLISLYPEIDSEDWFEKMVNAQLNTFSQEEDDKYCKSFLIEKLIERVKKVTTPEELQSIAKDNTQITDEEYIKAFSQKSDEFSQKDFDTLKLILVNPDHDLTNLEAMMKLPKHQALLLTKYKSDIEKLLNERKAFLKTEQLVNQVLEKLPTAKNPQDLILHYSPEVQNHHKIEEYFTQKLGIFQDGTKVPF